MENAEEHHCITGDEARQIAIFFTDATESRPFTIKQLRDGSRILTNELPVDREEICNPFKFPHHTAVSRKCCAKGDSDDGYKENPFKSQLDFPCCVFLGITVESYGTFALRIDVIDVNDNPPRFNLLPEFTLSRAGNDFPGAFDLDEGKNADLLFHVEKNSPLEAWEQHFKLLSGPDDRCITNSLTESPQRDGTFPALCLLGTIDRETVSGFTFDLIARDQGEPMALTTTLSMSIVVLDENDNAPTFKQSEFKVFVKENEVGKTLVHLRVTDLDSGENSRLSYSLRPGGHFATNQKPPNEFLLMHVLASPAPDGVVLRLIQPLDYEAVSSFDFEVVVQDHGTPRLASTATVSVEVLNTNDQPPVIRFFNKGNLLNFDYASLEREEDTDDQSPKVICHVHVHDQDTSLDEVFCEISSPQRLFDLREVRSENTIQRRKVYEMISLAQLDRERAPSYLVNVRCVDGRTATRLIGQSQVRIILKDANDNPPLFEKDQFFGTVGENEANALVDFRDSFINYGQSSTQYVSTSHIHATDADVGPNAAINYSLAPWNREGDTNSTISKKEDYEFFHIDRITGQLKTRVPLDFEAKSSYYLLVVATDQPLNASQALSSTAKLIITVKDLDDNPPTMLHQNYSFEVTESMPSHTIVGRVEATDADSLPENRIISYQLRTPTVPLPGDDSAVSSAAASATTSTASTTAALHFFTIDRLVRLILLDLLPDSTVVITILDKNDNAPYMVSLASPDKKRVPLAEVIIPSDKLQGRPPICVPFPYAFTDDDEEFSGNGNATVSLDSNPNFELSEDRSRLCLKVDNRKGKKKSITPPPPGQYSLNLLAQDNPKEIIHRLTKRFPLRVIIQSPLQDFTTSLGTPRHQESVSLFKSSRMVEEPVKRQPGKSTAAGRILGTIQRPSSTTSNRGVGSSWEHRNVTVIAVLVCMACILCVILLAILLFMKKCTHMKNFIVKDHHRPQSQTSGLNAPISVTLHDLSPKAGKFTTIGRYPPFKTDLYPCIDIQSQMLVTVPPGSENSFTISPTGQLMGSAVYTDDASQMTPLLTQKNNLMIPACHGDSLQKVSFGPIYGTACVSGPRPPTASVAKSSMCSIPLVAQYASQTPVTTTSPSRTQTYSALLPSKSYNELLHCSSTKTSTLGRQQQQPLLAAYNNVGKKYQEDYQIPSAQTAAPDDLNSASLNYNSTASFTPLQLTPSSSRSPSRGIARNSEPLQPLQPHAPITISHTFGKCGTHTHVLPLSSSPPHTRARLLVGLQHTRKLLDHLTPALPPSHLNRLPLPPPVPPPLPPSLRLRPRLAVPSHLDELNGAAGCCALGKQPNLALGHLSLSIPLLSPKCPFYFAPIRVHKKAFLKWL
ncbi:Protocadherin-1 [Echinococcus granulosus]|uniref:Protocadherin-1 n=1 Tax=Echinococcus granulosus TaxID=6210 RepID=W6UKQ5_ECHGR|nr:Protocadherin-1 [Echinococcus granulosus]EUB61658.1 Protocadherin-1 [Echinococcus granulosus]